MQIQGQLEKSNSKPSLFHGEKHINVPLRQSQWMLDALQKAEAPSILAAKQGVGRCWADDKRTRKGLSGVSWSGLDKIVTLLK